jgi:outer membrane receptor protein involved in Fe transport
MDYTAEPVDYWVFSNSLTMTSLALGGAAFVDFSNPPDGSGHNYYLNRTELYELSAWAAMGELYYRPFENFTVTLGLRYTHDEKDVFPVSPLLFGFLSGVVIPPPVPHQHAEFDATTGRLGFDWKFENTGLTDETLLYAFYSRGYKGGGFNPPGSVGIAGVTETFDPEFVSAYEIGLKNTLFDGDMLFNATAFSYDYEGYQISRIVQRTSINENIDATVRGAELELLWEPVEGLRFNGTLGYLDTEITGGSSLDVLDRAQGDPSWTLVHDPFNGQACLLPTSTFDAAFVNGPTGLNNNPALLGGICAPGHPLFPSTVEGAGPAPGGGVFLAGNELPNAPNWTMSFGIEYTWPLGGGWEATARGDYFRQGDSYMRIFNTEADELDAYENINLLFRVAHPERGLALEAFVQNATDEVAITDAYLTDDSSGLFRNIFLTDPRIFGLRATVEY